MPEIEEKTAYHAGFRDRVFDKDPFPLALWYPARGKETPVRHMGVASTAARNAGFAPGGPFPLVLISHGSEGHRFVHFWLAEYLARRGYIVAALQHNGDNYLDAADARSLAIIERRPLEMKQALDLLLAQDDIAPHIDATRICALGHSAGGATVFKLAGWQFDAGEWQRYCAANRDSDRVICEFVPDQTDLDRLRGRYGVPIVPARDERISAIIAIAPAFGVAATRAGFENVDIPMLVIEAETDEVLLHDVNAARFRQLLQGRAGFVRIKGAGHYSFLPPCTEYIAQNFPHLCRDFGRERPHIHHSVQQLVAHFLDRVHAG
ncbi:alpha/beta fold hydrolase [Thalassospira profundimaris]|uniref:alpha/beta hydrolase family protein n=1 Tax=Thalassospira profundimaris TaxID=502049 RepID=UPI000DEDC4BF|nr:alpha/beta fold hydrolase [Thalassospira profundimaris]